MKAASMMMDGNGFCVPPIVVVLKQLFGAERRIAHRRVLDHLRAAARRLGERVRDRLPGLSERTVNQIAGRSPGMRRRQ
jgi:hypothetical protein